MKVSWTSERQVPNLGARFVSEVMYLVERYLMSSPLAHPLVRGVAGSRGIRRALVDNFPFALIYASGDSEELVVIAVVHTSRTRLAWRRRLT